MRILAIETSCDETAVSIVEVTGDFPHATYRVLGNALYSQIDIHREFGGVYPTVAKREHAKTLVPMLKKALDDANLEIHNADPLVGESRHTIHELLLREGALADDLIMFAEIIGIPTVDYIAVTEGPGLEPALWVGVNFARALALLWKKPLLGINHMEGHIVAALLLDETLREVTFPMVSLLISGGHTELVCSDNFGHYALIGQTRDDAIGEAFDKTARLLDLPYPGGPELSRLAREARDEGLSITPPELVLPRPMMHSNDCDFSFSGIKTAVLYATKRLRELNNLNETTKRILAREFEDAVTEVLVVKTMRALEESGARTLAVGGGVSANLYIRHALSEASAAHQVPVFFPTHALSTDNAIMIALAAHTKLATAQNIDTNPSREMKAIGNLSLHR
jgi:N6-L-threonylcarbamoyladenine synthase